MDKTKELLLQTLSSLYIEGTINGFEIKKVEKVKPKRTGLNYWERVN